MVNKCNKMFSIFERNIVLSKNTRILAITPYDVEFVGNVLGIDDVVDHYKDHYNGLSGLCDSTLSSFHNPNTDEWWYIGRYLVAYENKKTNFGMPYPKILLLFSDMRVLVKEDFSDIYFKFKNILFSKYNNKSSKYTTFISNIGYLCYPEKPIVNDKVNMEAIKLPIEI